MCLTKDKELLQPTVPSMRKNARHTVPLYRKKNALCMVPDLQQGSGVEQVALRLLVSSALLSM